MFAPRPLLLPLLLLGAACLTAGSPAPSRQRRSFSTLPGGTPLQVVFAKCEVSGQSDDIGPCLPDLLRGAIDAGRPNFTTGLQIGDDNIVLEPLKLDDIEPYEGKGFQMAVTNLFVHGISTLNINNVTFNSNELALNLSFTNVTATGDMKMRYLLLSTSPQVTLELSNLTVLVHTNFELALSPNDPSRLDLTLSNATAKFELGDFNISASLENLGSAGVFIQKFINANSKTLVNFLVPGLERSLSKKLNSKLSRIKLAD